MLPVESHRTSDVAYNNANTELVIISYSLYMMSELCLSQQRQLLPQLLLLLPERRRRHLLHVRLILHLLHYY